ncbi:hypothetical protein [Nostoc sp. C110]|uniref:hypothetical protein n=1 Tax=Nostoc sp. C110 TaxID=3349876 RepID=UPI00370CFFB9
MRLIPAFLTSPAMATPAAGIALFIILTQNMFRAFLAVYLLMQCEKPESRLYKALRILVRNPGIVSLQKAGVRMIEKKNPTILIWREKIVTMTRMRERCFLLKSLSLPYFVVLTTC